MGQFTSGPSMRFLYAAAVSSPNGLRQEVRSREGPLPIFIPLFCPRKRTQKERRGESCFDMTSASLSLSPFCLQFLRLLLVLFDSIVFLIVVVFFFFFFYTSAVLIARHVAVCKDDFSFSFFLLVRLKILPETVRSCRIRVTSQAGA